MEAWKLWLYTIIHIVLLITILVAEKKLGRNKKIEMALMIISLLAMGFYLYCIHLDSYLNVVLSPYSWYVFYSLNWVSWFAVMFFAIAARNLSDPKSARAISSFGILIAIIYVGFDLQILWSYDHPKLNDKIAKDICIQSTSYSCTPASMVNFLQHYKIPASEQEMARLACTNRGIRAGTTVIGELHALTHKANGRYQVVFKKNQTIEQLQNFLQPVLVTIRLGSISHSILVEKYHDQQFTIIDPLIGRKTMTLRELRANWYRNVVYFERKID